MMLEVADGFVYLSRSVYDQAVILNDRFESNYTIIKNKLEVGSLQDVAIDYFWKTAPEPLNILAPYLGLVKDVELEPDIEELCGVLHQMATTINFVSFIRVPKEVRADVKFAGNFIRKYRDSWDSIETKLIVTEVDIEAIKLDAIEALLERIMPKTMSLTPQPIVQQVPVQSTITPVQTAPAVQETSNAIPVAQEVPKKEDPESVNDPFAVFLDLMEPETPEQKRDREARVAKSNKQSTAQDVTVDQIASVSMKTGMSQEKQEEVMKEAQGIKALVNRFGGAK